MPARRRGAARRGAIGATRHIDAQRRWRSAAAHGPSGAGDRGLAPASGAAAGERGVDSARGVAPRVVRVGLVVGRHHRQASTAIEPNGAPFCPSGGASRLRAARWGQRRPNRHDFRPTTAALRTAAGRLPAWRAGGNRRPDARGPIGDLRWQRPGQARHRLRHRDHRHQRRDGCDGPRRGADLGGRRGRIPGRTPHARRRPTGYRDAQRRWVDRDRRRRGRR